MKVNESIREMVARKYSENVGVDFDLLPEKYKQRNYLIADTILKIPDIKKGLELLEEAKKGNIPDCSDCFYKQRYSPPKLYDSDFGRTTGTQKPE